MSRGGRRGFGRGRGGKERIGGQEVSWDYDPELEVDNKPQELFPKIEVPRARPPTKTERAQVERYKAFRQRIHDSPLYTVLGDDVRITKPGAKLAKIQIDPFEDMPSYTQKYKPPSRKLPTFSSKPYDFLRCFPKELWSTVDPKAHAHHKDETGEPDGVRKGQRSRKRHQLPGEDDEEEDTEKKGKGQDENVEMVDDEDDASTEKNPEDDFSEDDSDMGADYNAEGYFDAGEDDFDAGNMEGGDDGGFD